MRRSRYNSPRETPKGKCVFMNETMKPSCGEAYDATPVAVLAASETLTIALGMLTKSPVAAIVAGGLTGCVCSLALPAISGRILGRKRDAILSWWDENLEVYKKFKVENPDREPSKRAEKREERDLAIWWLDAMRLVRTKELMREKVEALIETGSRMPDGVNLDDYETVEPSSVSRYSPSRSRAVPSWHESSPRTIRLSRKAPIRAAISRHRRCSRSTSMTRRGSMGTR